MAFRRKRGNGLTVNSAESLDVLVAGELFVDLIMGGFKFWPQPGKEAFAKVLYREIGGAAITACGLAKLGSRTGVFGVVGEDSGTWIVDELRRSGVGTSTIRFDPAEPTGLTVVATTADDRAFLTYSGANCSLPAALVEAVNEKQLPSARHMHLAYSPELDVASNVLGDLRENGYSLSADVGWHEAWLRDERAVRVLRMVDIYFPNELEARCMTGEEEPEKILDWFAAAGISRVALKLGASGAALLWDGAVFFATAHQVAPVDPSGAGDSFDAGFLHAWLRGESPEMCLRTANICGALSTEAYGGIAGFPSPQRVEEELGRYTCAK